MSDLIRRLSARTIEDRATSLRIRVFSTKRMRLPHIPPVPVEEIVEQYLGLQIEFDDLTNRGIAGAHGATIVVTKQMFIDQSLDPTEHPKMEGRYRFTVAHEIGHWCLHPRSGSPLFVPDDPRFVADYREYEWQAEKFASYLLMPTPFVRKHWLDVHGSAEPLRITPELEEAGSENFGSRAAFIEAYLDMKSEALAERFRVSVPTMRIRLHEPGLLPPALAAPQNALAV